MMRSTHLTPLLAALPSVLATVPQRPDFSNTTTLPTRFGLLLFPHFQTLDVFGPMDVFNSLSMQYSNVSMSLTVLAKTLDPVSSGMTMGGMTTFGEAVVPTLTFDQYLGKAAVKPIPVPSDDDDDDDCEDGEGNHFVRRQHDAHKSTTLKTSTKHSTKAPTPTAKPTSKTSAKSSAKPTPSAAPATGYPPIEVLIVPGGGGTRNNLTDEIAFVKAVYPSLKYIISVCTGASILARAGVLDNKRATTNKRAWAWATGTGPNTTWVPTARWVEDGNVWSSSGISAGIDVTYAFVSRLYGEPVADYLAKSAEYERWLDPHTDPFAQIWEVPGAV